ncbi:MAG TPA: hypothetical protein DCQ98_05990 [Planctomycetaceae bacterium]|nr:hypothetical protein [Planctomycetaceae bacterium]HRF01678.1 hypothetical protein [Pirellulaceae bacterium]
MTPAEFREWLIYHGQTFPDWYAKVATTGPETLSRWRGVLVGIDLESAKRATDEMLAGSIRRPWAIEEHVTAIRQRASQLQAPTIPVRDTRQQTYACGRCLDSGFASIVHPRSVELAQAGEFDRWLAWFRAGSRGTRPALPGWTSAAVWCYCSNGQQRRDWAIDDAKSNRAKSVGWDRLELFDPDRHVAWSQDSSAMIEKSKKLKAVTPHESLDSWNSQHFAEGPEKKHLGHECIQRTTTTTSDRTDSVGMQYNGGQPRQAVL